MQIFIIYSPSVMSFQTCNFLTSVEHKRMDEQRMSMVTKTVLLLSFLKILKY